MDYAPLFRPRHDGWTPDRQAAFLVALTAGRSIAAAAAAAGMSRQSAYGLRRRSPAVAAAWDSGGPPVAAAEFDAIVEAEAARRDAVFTAARTTGRSGDAWLLAALRADARRAKRRAAAARRRAIRGSAASAYGIDLCRLLPRLGAAGGVAAPFDARDRGAGGRFVARNVVAASGCVTFRPKLAAKSWSS